MELSPIPIGGILSSRNPASTSLLESSKTVNIGGISISSTFVINALKSAGVPRARWDEEVQNISEIVKSLLRGNVLKIGKAFTNPIIRQVLKKLPIPQLQAVIRAYEFAKKFKYAIIGSILALLFLFISIATIIVKSVEYTLSNPVGTAEFILSSSAEIVANPDCQAFAVEAVGNTAIEIVDFILFFHDFHQTDVSSIQQRGMRCASVLAFNSREWLDRIGFTSTVEAQE